MKNGRVYKPQYVVKSTGERKESAIWWMKYYVDGKPRQENTHTKKKKEALGLLAQRTATAARGEPIMPKMNRIKFAELADGVVRDYERNGKDTVSDVKTRLRLNILPFFGRRPALSITTPLIEKYKDERLKQKTRTGNRPANGTINRELAIIKRAFRLAMKARQITTVPHIPMLKENNVRKGFYEPERFEEALDLVGMRPFKDGWIATMTTEHADVVRDFVRFLNVTGWRSSEAKSLLWENIDFAVGRAYLEDSKNEDARYFPITDDLEKILKARLAYTRECELREPGDSKIEHVFHRGFWEKGEKKGQEKNLVNCERSWKMACKRADMGDKIMHDFRRTAVRSFRRAGIPDKVAMKLSGHKTRSVFDRYSIVDERDLDVAADLLNQASSKTGTVSGTVGQNRVDSELSEVINS